MNSKHAFLALSVFTLVSIAHGEREVFAPTKLAPVVDAGTIRLDNGTAGVPTLSFKSDTDTGLYRNGANTLSLTTNAVGKFHVTSSATPTVTIGDEPTISSIPLSGILRATSGSGTNIAGGNLTIQGGNSTGNAAGGYVAFQTAAAGAAGATNNTLTERMRIDSAGLVGIGTTPSVLLDVLNPSAAASSEVARFRGDTASTPYIGFFNGANRTGYIQYSATSLFVGADTNKNIQITTTGTGDILQNTGGSERMRITSAGNVVVGNGDTSATPAASTIRGTDGSGTNIAAANLTIQGGRGTGTGAGGAVVFQTSAAGTSGSTLNAATERMRITSAGVMQMASGSYIDAGAGKFELPNGTAIPATCTVGELFQDTDSNDCINTGGGDGALCICKTTNTWALISNF